MKQTIAILAALALLAPAAHITSAAFADKKNGKTVEAATQSDAEESNKDDGLKSIEQGFSIPAADGTASGTQTPKKAPPKK